ncbi:ATPase [bacterium]|nr:MAG: ATPase [bacterium]
MTLPSDLEIVVTREFNAPNRLVFAAWTQPEHIRRWWGCNGSTLPVCEVDLQVGGAWRYVLHDPTGGEHGFHGVYREVEPTTRLVHTLVYEPMAEYEALVTVLFEEHDGKTTLIETTLHQSTEARDAHLKSGMADGLNQVFAYLDELLEQIA